MGQYTQADTVRITWPNGLIQNEPQKPVEQGSGDPGSAAAVRFLPDDLHLEWREVSVHHRRVGRGSTRREFAATESISRSITMNMCRFRADALRERDGKYEVRVTEELHEVSYIDQIQLIAVDHPAEEEIFTNDKFKSPPFPEFRLFGVDEARSIPKARGTTEATTSCPRCCGATASIQMALTAIYTGIAELALHRSRFRQRGARQ